MIGYTKYSRLALRSDKMAGSVFYRAFLIFSAAALVLAAASAIAGGIPKWVTKAPEDKEYLYFVGIKTDALALEDGKRLAINQAVTELVEHFEIRLKSRYYEKKTEIETTLLDEIESKSTDVRVRGALLKDWYFEKPERGFDVYVLVRYPRAELEMERQRAQNDLARKASSVRGILDGGVNDVAKGDVRAAYLAFTEALGEAEGIEDEGLRSEALEKLRALLQGIEIEAVSGEEQRAEAFKRLKEPLVARVFVRAGGARVPVKGLPVLFSTSGHGDCEGVVLTDEKGFASYQELKAGALAGALIVTATLEPGAFLPYAVMPKRDRDAVEPYIEALGLKRAVFTLGHVAVRNNIRVIVSMAGPDSGAASAVEGEISAGLSDAGYDVVAMGGGKADIIVTGEVRSRKGSGNMEWTFSTHANGFIRTVDGSTGRVIAQKNYTAVGFGETEALAEANAFRKLGEELTGRLMERMAEGGD
ncbi:MAG: hypothetical protein HZA14_13080 [Nitrospirae bacterium]|nr:hypothetical protein [Nitrospirota bacterium]